jgi:hypothetical protein
MSINNWVSLAASLTLPIAAAAELVGFANSDLA